MGRSLRIIVALVLLVLPIVAPAQRSKEIPVNAKIFGYLDLDNPQLSGVKEAYQSGDTAVAAQKLLDYFRSRITTGQNKTVIKTGDQQMADDALEHRFFAHSSYEPLFYGEDINWDYWPIKDNELRWQLHRHKWFTPMGRVYRVTDDERYARAWVDQFMDWIEKNPLDVSPDDGIDDDNVNYSWRTLEVSIRLNDQCNQLPLYIESEWFTPAFLTQFLVNYYRQVEHIMGHFSAAGNHLLFEAQRVLLAGSFFPEFRNAEQWRKTGVTILAEQIKAQVYDDGFQYELCPHYHLESIRLFMKGLEIAQANGYQGDIPESYRETIEKMVVAYYNILFADYSPPMFSDTRYATPQSIIANFASWHKLFAENQQIEYFATRGASGSLPDYTSRGFLDAGFFTFRSGWLYDDTAMIVKAGPVAFWHNQPDNGTFDLWIGGRNFFPDSGCYVYAGDESVMKWRNWFRSTASHTTLTLDNRDLDTTDSRTLLWDCDSEIERLVTQNQSYEDLAHRRSIYFVEKSFFVIVDEALGDGSGEVGLHFQLDANPVLVDTLMGTIATTYTDGNNILMRSFSSAPMTIIEEQGWMSREYLDKVERPAYSFVVDKSADDTAVRYITVILPVQDAQKKCKIDAKILKVNDNQMELMVKVQDKKYKMGYDLQ